MLFRLEVEGIPPPKLDERPRAKLSTIKGYIRDKIKTLRAADFWLHNPKNPKCEEEKEVEEFMNDVDIYGEVE